METTMIAPSNIRQTRLTQEEIAHYHEKGYVIPQCRLPERLTGQLREMLERLMADNPTIQPEKLMAVHIPKGNGGGVKGRKEFFDLVTHSEIVGIVEQLIGPDICLWGSHMFCKPAGKGMEVPWHQDGQYWPIRPLATVTAWIAFEDADVENGCMRVIPRSHRARTLYPHVVSRRKDLALNQVLEPGTFDESEAVNIELKAGQISFHDIYLVHGSNANRSNRRRAGYTVRYMPTTSHFDRAIDKSDPNGEKVSAANFPTRPIWLLRGVDRCGKNDFTIGHANNDFAKAGA